MEVEIKCPTVRSRNNTIKHTRAIKQLIMWIDVILEIVDLSAYGIADTTCRNYFYV